jgi:hypothetical protein
MIGHPLFNYYVATLEMEERRRRAEQMRQARAARRSRRPQPLVAPVRGTEGERSEQERRPTLVA